MYNNKKPFCEFIKYFKKNWKDFNFLIFDNLDKKNIYE